MAFLGKSRLNAAAFEHRNSAKYKKNRAQRTPAALPTGTMRDD